MEREILIIHGWDGDPNEPMLQWLKKSLENKGYSVTVPAMPDTETPRIEPWVKKIKESVKDPNNTMFVGHSIGAQAILRYIETLSEEVKIPGIVMIAPWMDLDKETIKEEGEEVMEIAKPWVETPIDFQRIKTKIEKVIAIFSDTDPFVPLDNKDLFEKELKAETIVEHEKGHFTISDDVRELPSALNIILSLLT